MRASNKSSDCRHPPRQRHAIEPRNPATQLPRYPDTAVAPGFGFRSWYFGSSQATPSDLKTFASNKTLRVGKASRVERTLAPFDLFTRNSTTTTRRSLRTILSPHSFLTSDPTATAAIFDSSRLWLALNPIPPCAAE